MERRMKRIRKKNLEKHLAESHTTAPLPVKDLAEFEKDLFDLLREIKFRRINCNFQSKLKEDIQNGKASDKV